MGGLNGLHFFLTKTAIQGSPDVLTAITKVYTKEQKKNSVINILSKIFLKELKLEIL